jgi:DNA topoisomerase-3
MSKGLIITEKPSVARDIASALGGFDTKETEYFESDQFIVSWAVGHLLEFLPPEEIDPKYKRWVLEDLPIIPTEFEYAPKTGQSERLRVLKKLYSRDDVSHVINACDAGREGELIFREIIWYFHKFKNAPKPRKMERLWLSSMTKEAIRDGFRNLQAGHLFDGLSDAAVCRSEADWLIGINATRALTRRMKTRSEKTAWSAGRVQTPTLALLVDRELENLTHRPTPFWRLQASFDAGDHKYHGIWFNPKFVADPDRPEKDDWIKTEAEAQQIAEAITGKTGVASETRKLAKESARPLFDLTTLQREANSRFGFSARRTLQAAQRLYESHKVLTYPRTDSKCLPADYRNHVDNAIAEFAQGGPYQAFARNLKKDGLRNTRRIFDDSKVSDHFAIIPTGGKVPNLDGDDQRIYDLVVKRFLAAFYPPAEWIRVERETVVEGHSFRTRSRFLDNPGWYEVYGKEAADEETVLPPLGRTKELLKAQLAAGLKGEEVPDVASEGQPVRTETTQFESDETRAPARYTEARLLSLMENAGRQVDDEEINFIMRGKGLGTPATRADIIENLVSKQYARRAERTIRATPKGILLIDLLRRMHADRLASPILTGEMEMRLQEVEQGQRTRADYTREVVEYTIDIVEKAKSFQYDDLYANDEPLGPCPTAPGLQVVERSRFYCSEDNQGKSDVGVGFIIWKERNGRYLDRTTIRELLQYGETPLLDGFLSAQGQGYKGRLKLDEKGELQLVSEDGSPVGSGTVAEISPDALPLTRCPFGKDRQIFETDSTYQCQCDDSCKEAYPKIKTVAVLPKVVCKREMKPEEAKQFFEQGRTEEFDDFTSRYGRPFKAKLVLKDNGKHGFEFAPRAPRAKAAKAEGGTEVKAKSAAKGKAKSKSKAKAKAKSKTAAKSKAKSASKKTTKAKKVKVKA